MGPETTKKRSKIRTSKSKIGFEPGRCGGAEPPRGVIRAASRAGGARGGPPKEECTFRPSYGLLTESLQINKTDE